MLRFIYEQATRPIYSRTEPPTVTIHGPESTQYTQRFVRELLAEVGARAQIGSWPPPYVPSVPQIVMSPQTARGLPFSNKAIGFQMENNAKDGSLDSRVIKSIYRLPLSFDYSESNRNRAIKAFPRLENKIEYWPIVPLIFNHDFEFRLLQKGAASVERDVPWLFIGALNSRRSAALAVLQQIGSGMVVTDGRYGKDLFDLVARSKVVVSVSYYESLNLDVERFSMVRALGAAYLGEPSEDLENYPAKEGMHTFSYGDWNDGANMLDRMLNSTDFFNGSASNRISSLPSARQIVQSSTWSRPLDRLLDFLGTPKAN